jgi:HD superfamily phosphohydrolase
MCDLLVGVLSKSPQFSFLRQFVVGELDMDRTDYLLRDSHHCGVEYGRFDHLRLLESLAVHKHPDSGRLQVGIQRGGEHTFEALILARYQMNTQVYYHRIRRIYDHYLTRYVSLWGRKHYKTFDDVLAYTDVNLIAEMEKDAIKSKSPEQRGLAKRVIERKHHRAVYETGDNADAWKLRQANRILNTLKNDFRDIDFILDDAKGSIHRVIYRGQQDDTKVEDFYVVEKYGNPRLITEQSGILEKIPTDFRNVRIYADTEDPTLLERISKAALDAEKG